MLIIGPCMGIRSERRLCEEVPYAGSAALGWTEASRERAFFA
jgi:hypothetical protein